MRQGEWVSHLFQGFHSEKSDEGTGGKVGKESSIFLSRLTAYGQMAGGKIVSSNPTTQHS